jgi:hypothetical protein
MYVFFLKNVSTFFQKNWYPGIFWPKNDLYRSEVSENLLRALILQKKSRG